MTLSSKWHFSKEKQKHAQRRFWRWEPERVAYILLRILAWPEPCTSGSRADSLVPVLSRVIVTG